MSPLSALATLLQQSDDPVDWVIRLFDVMAAGLVLSDKQGNLLYWNLAAKALHGFPREETLEMPLEAFQETFAFFQDGQPVEFADWPLSRLLSGQSVENLELDLRRLDTGQEWSIRYDGCRLPRGLGREDLVFLTMQDLTATRQAERKLRRSDQLLQTLSDFTEDAIFIKDRSGSYQFCNRAAGRIVGKDPSEILGKDDTSFFTAEDAAQVRRGDVEIMESGRSSATEEILSLNGKTRVLLTSRAPSLNPAGEVIGVVGVTRDITSYKAVEQELKEERDRFAGTAEAAPGALYTFYRGPDGKQRFLYTTSYLEDIYGVPQDALHLDASEAIRRIHPEDLQGVLETLEQSRVNNGLWQCEYRVLHPEKGEIWVEGRAVPHADGQGGTLWHGILIDISSRKQVQASLLVERNRFEDIVASVPGAIYSFCLRPDGSMDFPYSSPGMERLFPVRAADLRRSADSVFQSIPETYHAELFDSIRKSAETLKPWRATVSVDHPEKGEIWIEGIAVPRRLEDGSTLWHGVLSDISDRRELEQQLFQAQKLEAVGRLAGGVAHDFNNLLTVINGYSDMALDDLGDEDPCYSPLIEIREAGERSARLTRQLLAFSRRAVIEPRVFDVNAQLRELQRMLKRLIGEDIELSLQPCAGVLPVLLDTGQFEQLVLNLAVNARDAMPGGGTLSLETRRLEGELLLSVSDTGCGMSREVLARIYEPFFTTKSQGKGTGLGLAVVHGVVSGGNGRLEVESRQGEGTTFRIFFPLSESNAEPQAPASRKNFRGTETVLVAEDDDEVRRVLVRGLESQGYKVILARDGKDAVRASEDYKDEIHLLLTDVVMPDLCGPDAAQKIQAQRPGLKVVFMTGYTEDERIPPDILQKPFTPYTAAERIRLVLDGPGAER